MARNGEPISIPDAAQTLLIDNFDNNQNADNNWLRDVLTDVKNNSLSQIEVCSVCFILD
jgi:hypothetical protein